MMIEISLEQYNDMAERLAELEWRLGEAVQVVRCKDCRWYDNRYGDVCHNPRYGDGWANYPPPYVDEDYWCKDGECKGGEEE